MKTIFISYSSDDIIKANEIKVALKKHGYNPYIAIQDPNPGRHISSKIENAIQQSDVFIVIVSNASNKSSWVQQEIGYAKGRKPIIPIRIDDTNPSAMLEGIDCLNYSPSIDVEIQRIIESVMDKYKQKIPSESEVCDDGPYTIKSGRYIDLPLNVEGGDIISGRLEEQNGDTFDWYIVDETNLVDFKNRDKFTYSEYDEDAGTYQVKWKVPKRPKGPWYLILSMYGKKNPRVIQVLLRRD